jgi:hypothetical protein
VVAVVLEEQEIRQDRELIPEVQASLLTSQELTHFMAEAAAEASGLINLAPLITAEDTEA